MPSKKARLQADNLVATEEFNWVKVAASGDDYRPVLHAVRVESNRLIAADGFRMRVWDVPTTVKRKKPQLRLGGHTPNFVEYTT